MSHQQPRFTLQLTLRDNYNEHESLHMAIGIDEALRISPRAIDEMRLGRDLGVSSISSSDVVTMLRTKEIRRRIFKRDTERLAGLLADRMEDAEGWHDPERIEPAREELGGQWR